jgi:hypothetical protein
MARSAGGEPRWEVLYHQKLVRMTVRGKVNPTTKTAMFQAVKHMLTKL